MDAVLEHAGGLRLFRGKVVDVARRATEGFLRGTAARRGPGRGPGPRLPAGLPERVHGGVARRGGTVTVPDIICVMDATTGEAIGTEALRYGQRVRVVALPAPALQKTAEGARARGSARVRPRPRLQVGLRFHGRGGAMRRIGIDVGGTNTDAVLIDARGVVAAVKTPTTEDVTRGSVRRSPPWWPGWAGTRARWTR